MPIFEYACRSCGHRFEALVFGGKVPPCPECEGADLEKLLSSFAVGGNPSGASVPPGCSAPAGGG
jgi:putative FmdB family regulatory protein